MMRRLFFFLSEAFIGMKRAPLMMIVAQATIFISLLIFGFFLILNFNLMQLSDHIGSKLEIRVFLKEGLTKKEVQYFGTILPTIEGVKSVSFVDKDQAWKSFRTVYSNLEVDSYVEENPLPHSFSVHIKTRRYISDISVQIQRYSSYVDEVVYGQELADRLQRVSQFVLVFGWSLVCLLSVSTLLIMMNTIRLTILNRMEEITIMKLVGATDAFIIGPFLMEGLLLGVLSSSFAVCALHFSFEFISHKLDAFLPFMPSFMSEKILLGIYGIVILWGSILSSLGAFLSIKSSLKQTI